MAAVRMLSVLAMTSALLGLGESSLARGGERRFTAIGTIELGFTPSDPIDSMISEAIRGAEREVVVHAFTFTSRKIAAALIAARRRGVHVAVLADREQAAQTPHNVLPDLVAGGVDVRLDGNFAAAHNKVIVIDAALPVATTITGSYNFTVAAQRRNAENVIILRANPPVAHAYRENWERLYREGSPWRGTALTP